MHQETKLINTLSDCKKLIDLHRKMFDHTKHINSTETPHFATIRYYTDSIPFPIVTNKVELDSISNISPPENDRQKIL